MSYQTLANKWRPQTFNDVIGQKYIIIALKNSLSLGRIHHAYLFSGTRGVGKTSIARLLAKGLNCETGITSTPCRVCKNCCEIEQGKFIDLIEIDAASKTKIEDIREILDSMVYAPTKGRFKVYLIDEVHMLSRYSFNALLKTLEEPPLHIKCLLATTDPQKLPITILSRCLQFHLKILEVEQIYHRLAFILNKEKILYDSNALQVLARKADGSLRDALSLTDQAIIMSNNGIISKDTVKAMLNMVDYNHALSLIEAIVNSDVKFIFTLINEAAIDGIDWENLLIEMQCVLHRIAIMQFSSTVFNNNVSSIKQRMYKLAYSVKPTDIQFYYQILLTGRKELSFFPDKKMSVEMTLLRTLTFSSKKSLLKSEEIDNSSCNVDSHFSADNIQNIHMSLEKKSVYSQPLSNSLSLNQSNKIIDAKNKLQCIKKKIELKKNEGNNKKDY